MQLRRHLTRGFLTLAFCVVLLAEGVTGSRAEVPADNGAVVLIYHRFGENQHPSTNIRLEQFEAHIETLTSGKFTVLPLLEIIGALERGEALPDRTVAITIDDAFLSVYTEAWPRLQKAGLPFTLFVATELMDGGGRDFMSWAQLKEMQAGGLMSVGAHSQHHGHMAKQSRAENQQDLDHSAQRFREELGGVPPLFAYPFGEYNLELLEQVKAGGYRAAFGQQSGAVGRTSDRFALPRYPLNEAFGGEERFQLIVNSLPLPVVDVVPLDPTLSAADNPPAYGFTLVEGIGPLNDLACYAGGDKLEIERLGEKRLEVRVNKAFGKGRSRINCTALAGQGRWRWLGQQFYIP